MICAKCKAAFDPRRKATFGEGDDVELLVEVNTKCPSCGEEYCAFVESSNWQSETTVKAVLDKLEAQFDGLQKPRDT